MLFRLNDAIQRIDYDNFVHVTKISREENSLKNSQVFDLTLWGTKIVGGGRERFLVREKRVDNFTRERGKRCLTADG
jgi:hypothetical protein